MRPRIATTVTVSVRDSKNDDGDPDTATDDRITVTINVGNVDEAGMVTLMGTPPQELQQLTAALSDPDGGQRGISWQWARSANSTGPWTDIIGETSARYTPKAADLGQYLQATATYTDDQGSGKRASQATTTSVQAAPKVKLSPVRYLHQRGRHGEQHGHGESGQGVERKYDRDGLSPDERRHAEREHADDCKGG